LDFKLRQTAKGLKSWSVKHIGSVHLQLAIAKEIVFRLDSAQDTRVLAPHELALRRKAKLCSMGLASLQRTLVCQRARITYQRAIEVTKIISPNCELMMQFCSEMKR
jgi:hypothetical protein